MDDCGLSEFEQARARKLGQELTNRLSQFCEREFSDQEMAELRRIREDLEKMGFHIEWCSGFDMATGKGTASVKLWLPEPSSGGNDQAPATPATPPSNDESA